MLCSLLSFFTRLQGGAASSRIIYTVTTGCFRFGIVKWLWKIIKDDKWLLVRACSWACCWLRTTIASPDNSTLEETVCAQWMTDHVSQDFLRAWKVTCSKNYDTMLFTYATCLLEHIELTFISESCHIYLTCYLSIEHTFFSQFRTHHFGINLKGVTWETKQVLLVFERWYANWN